MSAIDKVLAAHESTVVPTLPQATAKSQSPKMDDKVIYKSPPLTFSPKNVTDAKKKLIDNELLQKIVEKLSHEFRSVHTSLDFSVDDKTKSLVVKVIESDSEKVIRQIPPDEVLAIRNRIQELLGAIFDKEA